MRASTSRADSTDRALDGLQYLAGLQAAGADVLSPRSPVDEDPDLLEVGVEAALRGDHRVAAAVAERRPLLAHVTHLRHGGRERSSAISGARLGAPPSSELRAPRPRPGASCRHRRAP